MCHDSAMDTGEWRRSDEPASITDTDEDDSPRQSRLASAGHQWRGYVTQHGRRGAVIGVGAAFVLLLASQWMPWANVVPQSGSSSSLDVTGNLVATVATSSTDAFNVGIDDANTAMILTYHLIWVIVLALAGATVFAPRRMRQPLFGAAIGTIVVQFVAIVPLLRHPKGLIVNAISDIGTRTGATELVVTRQPGMFCAVAALVVLAGSMVFAVEGNVLPSLAAEFETEPLAGTPRPDLPAVDIAVDIEVVPDQSVTSDGRPAGAPAIDTVPESPGHTDVVAFTVEAVEGLPEHPVVPAPPPVTDHTAYARPLGNDKFRR
jgi:hypothetical protein